MRSKFDEKKEGNELKLKRIFPLYGFANCANRKAPADLARAMFSGPAKAESGWGLRDPV
jgi:hypothetical protein